MGREVADVLIRRRIPVDGFESKYSIRQPGTEEYDEAAHLSSLVRAKIMASGELDDLKLVPCSQNVKDLFESEIRSLEELLASLLPTEEPRRAAIIERIADLRNRRRVYSLADELADRRAALIRDRYLCGVLLCDVDGHAIIPDPSSVQGINQWEELSLNVKNAARPAIWEVLRLVEDLPFGSVPSPD